MDLGVKTRNVHLRVCESFRKCILIVHKETKAAGKAADAWSWSGQLWKQHRGGLRGEWLKDRGGEVVLVNSTGLAKQRT